MLPKCYWDIWKVSPGQIQRNGWILWWDRDTVSHLQLFIIQTDLPVVLPLPLSLKGVEIKQTLCIHTWLVVWPEKIIITTKDEENKYLNRLSDPCQAAHSLLLPLGLGNLFGLFNWNIDLFNSLIIFSLLNCQIWASEIRVVCWKKELRTRDLYVLQPYFWKSV